jgi:tetratricopeptide (TPR) repeat protein
MARGAAQTQRKQRPKTEAKRKRSAPTYEQTMFFPRLRRQAKWVFVFLALVFGVGFVAFGVGSGSTGISDVLRGNFFGGGSGSSSQIKSDKKKIERNPKNIEPYLDLAGVYQQKQQNAEAIATLRRAQQVAPKNFDVLNRLAGIYSGQAEQAVTDFQNAQIAAAEVFSVPPLADTSSTIAQAFSQDPFTQSLQKKASDAQTKALGALQRVEGAYKGVVKASVGTSNEAGAQLQLGSVAQRIGDTTTAIAAYKRYLRINPDSPNAGAVRQTLAQLKSSLPQSQR